MDVKVFFSDFFELEPKVLEEYDASDISFINDLPVFIVPFFLLFSQI
ncbi:hypothetical protein B4083_2270 [Bacillus cereus]|nr:hypothetical protein B4083_2270 [Bacillus cereus]